MKKIIKKLVLITIITLNLLGIFASTTFAAEKKKEGNCLSDIEKKENIITIVEEAFTITENGKKGDNFRTKMCYRVYDIDPKNPNTTYKTGAMFKACPNDEKVNCDPVQILLTSKGGLTMLYGYIGYLYKWAAGFVGLIAVAVIIVSSAQISLSGGDIDAVKSAKDRIIKSLSGIAILFLSSLILHTINPTFFTL